MEATSLGGGDGVSRHWRERSGFLLAPAAFVIVWFAPLGVDVPAHRLAAILATVVVLWITEAIPMAMTAFLGVAARRGARRRAGGARRSRPSPIR